MRYLTLGLLMVILYGCGPWKPDYVDENGKEYEIRSYCVKSHSVSEYCYHYGYNFMSSKYEWHWGMDTKTICDSTSQDTVEINLKQKYYTKN